jgi:alginate O-acetyltransferase complex protein AlgJ
MRRPITEQTSAPEQPSHLAAETETGLVPPERPLWCPALSDKLLAILFVLFLLTPALAQLMGWKGWATLHENRRLAAPPTSDDPIEEWPAKLEAYYNDSFGFRADLVHFNALLLHKYLKAPSNDVLIGKQGWTFFTVQKMFEDFFGKAQFSDAELVRWKSFLEGRQSLLARGGAHYVFVIVPDKNTIYPEYLPDYIRENRGTSRLQQLRRYLQKTGSPAEVLDLHEAMLRSKGQGELYLEQDAHWNGRGFFVGYQAICERLAHWIPGIRPQQLGIDYKVVAVPWGLGDWSMLGLPEENLNYRSEFLVSLGTQRARKGVAPFPAEITQYPDPLRMPYYREGPGQNSLLMFNDSFMHVGLMSMEDVPFAEHFARTLMVGMQPSDRELQLIVDKFHPDVVIEERAERFMSNVPLR